MVTHMHYGVISMPTRVTKYWLRANPVQQRGFSEGEREIHLELHMRRLCATGLHPAGKLSRRTRRSGRRSWFLLDNKTDSLVSLMRDRFLCTNNKKHIHKMSSTRPRCGASNQYLRVRGAVCNATHAIPLHISLHTTLVLELTERVGDLLQVIGDLRHINCQILRAFRSPNEPKEDYIMRIRSIEDLKKDRPNRICLTKLECEGRNTVGA